MASTHGRFAAGAPGNLSAERGAEEDLPGGIANPGCLAGETKGSVAVGRERLDRQADGMAGQGDAGRNWLLFMLASIFLGATSGIYENIFNNYLSDVYHVSTAIRGLLELPREMPGVSIVFIAGFLALIPEIRVAALAVALWGLGLLGMGFLAPDNHLPLLVFWMSVWSVGTHLFMPLNQSIGVSVAGGERIGSRLGQLAGANTAAGIVGAAVVWWVTRSLEADYRILFALAGATTMAAFLCLLPMRAARHMRGAKKTRFVIKRRYRLFYALSILYGARKQVFMTFGPWVIIRIFHQPPSTIALLWIIASVLGIAFKPLLGRIIDRLGERRVLMGEAAALILICLGYASGSRFGRYLTYTCYVLDQLLIAVTIARTTYLNKIAESPGDLAPTLALGISADHAVSMVIPSLGGLLWAAVGYEYVFVAAAFVAVLNLIVAARITRVDREAGGPALRREGRKAAVRANGLKA